MKKYLIHILIGLIALAIGIAGGILVRDWPKFIIDYTVKITDLAKLILTFGLGVFIPLIVKKLIEDKRSFKNSLMEEVNSFNKITSKIHGRLNTVYNSGDISQRDKDDFVLLFEISDVEFNQLCDFITDYCDEDSRTHIDNLKEKYIEFWKTLTGSEITKSSVLKIDDVTYKSASRLYNEMKNTTRKIKASLNKM